MNSIRGFLSSSSKLIFAVFIAATINAVSANHASAYPYSVLLESNTDRTSNEIYIANYASYADLLSNTLDASSSYSALNVSSAFSVGGFTFDGSMYNVLLESNNDRTSNEIYIASYASYADLLSNTLASNSTYSQLNVSSAFNVGGFSYDGNGGYDVLLESRVDRTNNEIYMAHYASFADLIGNSLSSTSAYSDLNVSSAFSVGGLAVVWEQGDNGGGNGGGNGGETPVPEPATMLLFGTGIAGLIGSRIRRKK